MRKANDFRAMAVEELSLIRGEISKELFVLINEKKRTKKTDKPHLLRQKKKERARLLTILHEKQSLQS